MQTHGGEPASEAILSSHRDIRSVVRVDWDKDGRYDHHLSDLSDWVSDVNVDRALKGSAPEEVLLIEGSAAAEISITIGGEYQNPGTPIWLPMTGVFSKYQRFSPFYGKNLVGAEVTWVIQVNTEFGTVEYPQFIGQVRTIEPDRATNAVTVTALDRSELLRRPVRLAPWAIADEHVHTGKTGSQLAHSHWIIDTCLRQCGVSATPKRPVFREEQVGLGLYDGLLWYLTGNGSYLPTIGYMDNPHAMSFPADSTPMYAAVAEKHSVAASDDARPLALYPLNLPVRQVRDQHQHRGVLRYWVKNQDELNAQGTHYLGFTLNTNGPNASLFQTIAPFCVMEVTLGRARLLEIWISAGKVYTRIMDHSSGQSFGNGTVHTSPQITIPTGQSHVDIHVQWDTTANTGVRCQVRAGANDSGWVSTGATPATSGSNILIDQVKGRVTVSHALSFSDMYFATRYVYGATTNNTYEAWREAAYGAVLDRGLNRFSYTPSKAEEAWKFITDVAAAEYGSVFWDENGVFRFWNYDTMRAKQNTSVRTFSLDDFTGLKMSDTIDSVRNIYNVETTRRRAVWAGGVYKSGDVGEFYTPGQSTRRFRLFRADLQSPLTFFMNKYSSDPGAFAWPKWDEDVAHGYCIQYYTSVGWAEMNERAGVNVSVYFADDGFLTVRVSNGWSEPIRFAKGLNENSSAAFHIMGTKIIEDDPVSIQYHNPSSVLEFGPQILDLDGDWHQEQFGANLIIPKMGQRTLKPIPATDAITVPGDPRIQLGDMVTLTDSQGLGSRVYTQILGIRREWSRDQGLTDTYSVEVVAQPGVIVVPDEPPPDPGGGGEPPDWEADVYVATTGSDSNDGLTPETPKLTLAGGMAAAGAGDVIKVFDGVYSGNFATSKAGTSGNPITFRAANKYGATLSGNGSTARQSAVEINHSYVNLRDFTITGANGSGVRHGVVVGESVSNVEITGNKFHNIVQFQTAGTGWQGGAGIDFWGPSYSNILIDGNIFYNIGVMESGEELTHGVYCGIHGTNFKIQNNLFYDIAGYGIHPYPNANSSGIQMYNNTVTGCFWGIRTVSSSTVRNNLCFENVRGNFNLQGTGSTIQNNLVGGTGGGSGTGITTISNPLFVNYDLTGSGDFRLQAGSPAVDAGTATGAPTHDLLGVTRPQGLGIDCGAYERVVNEEVPDPDPGSNTTPQGLTATPNNSTKRITLAWQPVLNASSYNIYSWYYRNGTLVLDERLVGTVTGTSSERGPLEDNATYYYQVTSIVEGAESQRTPIAWAVLGTDSTGPPTSGGGGNTGSTPAQILNIGSVDGQNRFKLGYGLANGGAYREVSHSDVTAGEVVPGIFEPNSDNSAVFFRVPVTAGTTGGSQYPRTEIREMQLNGTSLAAWNGGSGTHYMNYRFRVPSALPATKPWTCVGQIHGSSDDIFRVQIEAGQLRVRYSNPAGGSEVSSTIQSYSYGDWIDARIEVINGNGRFLINNVEKYTFACNTTGCYFKVGNYLQTNATIEADDSAVAVVELASYPVVWHTGYPDPALPGGGDPGSEDPPPGPGGGSSVPVGPNVDFIGDYNTGNFGQYTNIQCKVRNGSASGYDQSFYGAKILDGGGGHTTAFRCEIRNGDIPDFGGGERCEVRAPSSADVVEGNERWYEFSMKLDSASALPSSGAGWFIVHQWHAGSGSPPCCIELKNDGNLYVRNNALNWQNLLGSLSDRQWHDFVLHVKFSNNASTGFIEGWRDGVKTLNLTSRRTMSSSSCYYKQGIYRDAGESNTVILWHDGLRVTQP